MDFAIKPVPRRIKVVEVSSGRSQNIFPTAPLLSSAKAPWDGILVEQHRISMWEFDGKSPTEALISVQLAGSCELNVKEGREFRLRYLEPGMVSVVAPGDVTSGRMQDRPYSLQLEISLSHLLLNECARELFEGREFKLRTQWAVKDLQLYHISQALIAELNSNCQSGTLYGDTLARALAARLVKYYAEIGPIRHTGAALHLADVLDLIDHSIDADLDLKFLAGVTGQSPFGFLRAFKRQMGVTPHRYIMQRRIERAKQFLRDPRHSVSEVALSIGFRTCSHFTAAFRQATGVTPKAFRKRL